MRRRELLRGSSSLLAGALVTAGAGATAGCGGLFETRNARTPQVLDDRPEAVYRPTHVDGMEMVGMDRGDAYACALTYTYPHRFWTVTGEHRNRVEVETADSIHVMPVVWHVETGIVPHDANPSITITRDGDTVADPSPWVMLSQPMGLHFGENVQLDGDGTYDVTVEIGGGSARRTGALADAPADETFSFELPFSQSILEDVPYRVLDEDERGTLGAVEPMEMEMEMAMGDGPPATSRAPTRQEFPGTVRGSATGGDAEFVVATLDDATPYSGEGDETYLAVSPRTPHHGYVLPGMSLSAALSAESADGGSGELSRDLVETIDPDLGIHYGASVPSVEAGDELTIAVDVPPQIARHEGYETAFFDTSEMAIELE